MAKNKFRDRLMKAVGDDVQLASDGIPQSDIPYFIDTGAYALNALISGSMYNGMPGNKILGLAGDEATGKSYIANGIAKYYQDQFADGFVVKHDSEGEMTTESISGRGIDMSRFIPVKVKTIEDYRTRLMRAIEEMREAKEADDPQHVLMILDSLGMLSSSKERKDILEGKEVRDMTRPGLIRGLFRAVTSDLSELHMPLVITNHTYQVIGSYVPMKDVAGGGGLKYAASSIIFLSKSKDRQETTKEILGNYITCHITKSRLTKEYKKVELRLSHTTGLDRYYGLLDIASDPKYNIIAKAAKGYVMPDGTAVSTKDIERNPVKYFTKDIMDRVEGVCATEFKFVNNSAETIDEELEDMLDDAA